MVGADFGGLPLGIALWQAQADFCILCESFLREGVFFRRRVL